MTSSLERLLSGEKKLLIWGANTHSYYLAQFCELRQINYSVVDLAPEKRQLLFPNTALFSVDDIESFPSSDYYVVICADEQRFGAEIKQSAKRLGFSQIWQLRELKQDFTERFKLSIPKWDESLNTQNAITDATSTLIVLPQFAVGGAEAQAIILASVLQQSGSDCHLLSLSGAHTNCPKFLAKLESSGVTWSNLPEVSTPTVEVLPSFHKNVFEWLYLNVPTTYLHRQIELLRLASSHSFNRIVSFLDDANIIAGIVVGNLHNVKGVLSLRSLAPYHLVAEHSPQPFMFDLDTMKALYQRLVAHKRIRCYANSTKGKDSYANWLAVDSSAISVIHNAIDSDKVLTKYSQTQIQSASQTLKIVGVMRLEAVKGPDDFIRVLAALRDLGIDYQATLVGDGSMRSRLEAMCKSLDLNDKLNFAGEQTETASFFADADILLHTARVEGLPNVLLEAQLAGCLVVCTNAGSSLEALYPGYHKYSASVGEIQALARNILRLLESKCNIPNDELLIKANEWVKQGFSTTQLLASVNSLFKK